MEDQIKDENIKPSSTSTLINQESDQQFTNQDSIINPNKSDCSPVEVPFELPPEVPSQLEVEYNKVERNDCAEEGQGRTTVHVEVNRSGERQGARRYSNVETWVEGYSDIPQVFGDVISELKVHDDKVTEHLQKPCPPDPCADKVVQTSVIKPMKKEGDPDKCIPSASPSDGNSICDIDWEHDRKRSVRKKMKDERKKYNSFSQQEDNCDAANQENAKLLDNPMLNFPTESTPNPTLYPEPNDETAVPIESKSLKKSSKIKPKKKKYRCKDIKCYSLDMARSRGFILKYAPEKGSCLLTADQKNPLKILDPMECAAIIIKMTPGKPVILKVIR